MEQEPVIDRLKLLCSSGPSCADTSTVSNGKGGVVTLFQDDIAYGNSVKNSKRPLITPVSMNAMQRSMSRTND